MREKRAVGGRETSGLVVMGGDSCSEGVVGLNPSIVLWMEIFPIY